MQNWKKEAARDLMALGGIPFYILVIARSLIGNHYLFTYQLLISIVFLYLVRIFIKYNEHLSRAIVLVVFTILFYNQLIYTIFASVVFIFLIISLFYLKIPKKEISFGFLLGIVSSLIAYYLAQLI